MNTLIFRLTCSRLVIPHAAIILGIIQQFYPSYSIQRSALLLASIIGSAVSIYSWIGGMKQEHINMQDPLNLMKSNQKVPLFGNWIYWLMGGPNIYDTQYHSMQPSTFVPPPSDASNNV